MFSDEKRFAFIHIPKTGGTSIEHALRHQGTVLQGKKNFTSIYYKHATASDLKRKLGPEEYDRCFKFTFVRNPWDWIVSLFAFSRGFAPPYVFGTPHPLLGRVIPRFRNWAFADWLPWWIENLSPSQTMMVVDDSGRLIVDFVGRFENLESDFAKMCGQAGLDAEPLPHLKASEREPYHRYYDDELQRLVVEHFREDFERFDYPRRV